LKNFSKKNQFGREKMVWENIIIIIILGKFGWEGGTVSGSCISVGFILAALKFGFSYEYMGMELNYNKPG
jgi:hypothetical protein